MARTLDDLLNAAKKKASSGNYQKTVKPQAGKSVWRILPGWDKNDPAFFHAFGQHFIKDAAGQLKVVIGCPDKTFDEPCEICDMIKEAAGRAPDDKSREKILQSRSTQRWLFNAIQVDKDENEVVILEVGSGLFNDIIANIQEDESIIDPNEGRDIVITREGTGLQTRYSMAVRSAAKSISVPKSALMELKDLGEFVQDDFESKKKKAMAALGLVAGALLSGSPSAGVLAGPDDLDDEIPDFDTKAVDKAARQEIEDAEVVDDPVPDDAKADAEAAFGADIGDEDIDALLADI